MSSGANKGHQNPSMIPTRNNGLVTVASVAAVIGGGFFLAYKLSRTQKKCIPSQKGDAENNKKICKASKFANVETDANLVKKCRITRLFVHPVKSCGGYEVRHADVLPRGLRYDREWVVVRRRDQKVMTIREIPAMRRITAIISEEEQGGQGHPVMFLSYRSLDESKNTVIHPLFDENKNRHPSMKIAEPTKVMFFVEIPITRNTLDHNISSSKPEASQFIDIFGLDGSVIEEAPQIASIFFTEALNEDKKKKLSTEEILPPSVKTDATMLEDEHYYLGRIARPRDPAQSKTYAKNVLDSALRIRAQDGSSLHILTEESMQWVCDQLYPTSGGAGNDEEKEKEKKKSSTATVSFSHPSLLTMPHLYRPNIVVRGVPFPEEDRWDTMSIIPSSETETKDLRGPILLKTFHNCDRCAVITTSLDGQRDKEFQPTRLLRERHSIVDPREGKPNKGMLGLNVNVRLVNASREGGSPNCEDDDETVLGVVSVGDTLIIDSFNTSLQYA